MTLALNTDQIFNFIKTLHDSYILKGLRFPLQTSVQKHGLKPK